MTTEEFLKRRIKKDAVEIEYREKHPGTPEVVALVIADCAQTYLMARQIGAHGTDAWKNLERALKGWRI